MGSSVCLLNFYGTKFVKWVHLETMHLRFLRCRDLNAGLVITNLNSIASMDHKLISNPGTSVHISLLESKC